MTQNKSIMIQGTASSAGKSILCTALCRILTQDGYVVNPFKAQNMSNNSFITPEGHEMGRAQVMQAEAARKVPSALMNPLLLKPTTDSQSQVVLKGKVYDTMGAENYYNYKEKFRTTIRESYQILRDQSDIVVIEGAGSPAEINLKEGDLVNMGMAKMAEAPVLLVGDIDRGGVFASLAGTLMLLDEQERELVKGVVINKFRGSVNILEPGLRMLEDIIEKPVLGVIPHFYLNIEDEDSVTDWSKFSKNKREDALDVAVINLPHISNFTDLNPLGLYDEINLRFVGLEDELGHPDLIIIPGTKSTIADMEKLADTGMKNKILKAHQEGAMVFGICGGYQILGKMIEDPDRVEATLAAIAGLGLLDIRTVFRGEKVTTLSQGIDLVFDTAVKGYEIHMGETFAGESVLPLLKVKNSKEDQHEVTEGAYNPAKTVWGTYFHGIFDNAKFTRNFVNYVLDKKGKNVGSKTPPDYWDYKDEQYDKLADIVRNSLDMDAIYKIIETGVK